MRSRRRVNDAAYFSPFSGRDPLEVDSTFNPDIRAAFQILRRGNVRGVHGGESVGEPTRIAITVQSRREPIDIYCRRYSDKSPAADRSQGTSCILHAREKFPPAKSRRVVSREMREISGVRDSEDRRSVVVIGGKLTGDPADKRRRKCAICDRRIERSRSAINHICRTRGKIYISADLRFVFLSTITALRDKIPNGKRYRNSNSAMRELNKTRVLVDLRVGIPRAIPTR